MPREEEAKGENNAGDGIEEEQLLECCNALEDLLLDDIMPADIYLGDDEDGDGGEEKGSELSPGQQLFVSVQAVCKEALPFFVDAVRDGMDVGEYLPEHQEYHERYLGSVEGAMSRCVDHFGFTLNSFVSSLRSMLSYNSGNIMGYATARELLEVIECVEKFNSFAEGMRVRAVQFLEKEEGGSDDFDFGRRR